MFHYASEVEDAADVDEDLGIAQDAGQGRIWKKIKSNSSESTNVYFFENLIADSSGKAIFSDIDFLLLARPLFLQGGRQIKRSARQIGSEI